ncbi:hypothetical protein KZ483_06930 [Paenibacillus sp. sptzw28]|uniref:hypothetical protein n=1 Tax=Paenibacillus sp. sptzw28 TaxID=715179 RepID=UPI001C6E7A39|nr:hypothetical protein [Paenibacillus sp. sptzw28]QYR22676.1 hypothetical protein KZ483_06930 [Paenibacillus sp. sptzw28]
MEFTKFIVFTLVSSIEYAAILIFIFTLFRIKYRWYAYHMIFVCVSLSYLSFTMREDQLAALSPFVQLGVLVILMWLLFQIHLGYSVFISFIGYFAYGLLQGFIMLLARVFVNNLEPFTMKMYLVALITSSVAIVISYYIKRKNWGYSFVPNSDELEISSMKKKELFTLLLVLLFLLFGVGIVYYAYYFTVEHGSAISFISAIIVLIVETSLLIYAANKKEKVKVGANDD